MVFRLNTEVFENRVRPESLHVVPVLDLTMTDGVVDPIARSVARSQSLITDEEVQILRTTLRGQVGARTTAAT